MAQRIHAETALLQELSIRPGFGLELIERVKTRTGGRVVLHQGSIYPALRSLEREGLLRSWEEPGPLTRGGPPRRYYDVTDAGREEAAKDRDVLLNLAIGSPDAAEALARLLPDWLLGALRRAVA